MTAVTGNTTVDQLTEADTGWKIDLAQPAPADANAPVAKALDVLIEGELKLLAIYDARQGSADTRTTALATAAIGLPTLILGLSKSFSSNALLLKAGYVVIIVLAFVVVSMRSWNAWRRRRRGPKLLRISAESADVAGARHDWRNYQVDTGVAECDPIRLKQLELKMWRTRAIDSRRVAEIKDVLSVVAAVAFGIALIVSAGLVWNARFTS